MINQLIERLDGLIKHAESAIKLEPHGYYHKGGKYYLTSVLKTAKKLQQKVRCENCKWRELRCYIDENDFCSRWEKDDWEEYKEYIAEVERILLDENLRETEKVYFYHTTKGKDSDVALQEIKERFQDREDRKYKIIFFSLLTESLKEKLKNTR